MKLTLVLPLAALSLAAASFTTNRSFVPDNYQLLFKEDFEDKNALKHFEMTDPSVWKITKQNGNRFGMKDPSNFYYTHLATTPDPHAHNIFLVNDEPRVAIADTASEGVAWGDNQWHRVKIERSLEDGSIKIYFDDMDTPIMQTTDTHFDYGYIGFGSFDDTGRIDNIRIWGPNQDAAASGFFVRGQGGR